MLDGLVQSYKPISLIFQMVCLIWFQLKQIALSNQQEEKTETKVNETELSQTEDVNVTLPPVNAKEPSSSLSPDSAKQREERETMTSPRLIDSADVPVVVESESIKTLNNQLNQVELNFLYQLFLFSQSIQHSVAILCKRQSKREYDKLFHCN